MSFMKYFLSQINSHFHVAVVSIFVSIEGTDENGENWYMTNNNQFTVH